MRKMYFFLLLCCLVGGLSAQTTYVNAAATGSNDGTSWANAFTSLDAALAAATAGEIWIAAGTYSPDATFTVAAVVSLLGGFNGTETMASQADPATNLTILSGDIAGDDDAADPTVNRDDNVRIMYVDSLLASVQIAGISFVGGQTAATPTGEFINDYSGGAVLSYSPVLMSNCNFTACVADFGAGVALLGVGSSGSSFDGINASGNVCFNNGVIYANRASNTTITGSTFTDNNTGRGAIYFQDAPGVFVDGCTFTANASSGPGGAIGTVRSFPVTVANTDFSANTGSTGGAVYFFSDSGSRFFETPDDHILLNCSFTENVSATRGGAVYAVYSNVIVEGCDFMNNVNNAGRGGAYYAFNLVNESLIFRDCDFMGNKANTGLGGAIYTQGVVQTSVTNCNFEANGDLATTRGGAVCFLGTGTATGVAMNIDMDSCSFNQNIGNSTGGAIHLQNVGNSTYFNLSNTTFVGNQGGSTGGALNMVSGIISNISNCIFTGNSSGGSGGGLSASNRLFNETTAQDTASMTLENCVFSLNSSAVQGGAVNIFGGLPSTIVNNGFYGNFIGDGGGAGGAIIMNGDSAITADFNLVNNTFYENTGVTLGDDLAFFLDPLDQELDPNTRIVASIQNNAFVSNTGLGNIAIEDGTPEISSLGGNLLVQDDVLGDFVTAADIVDTNSDFETFFVDVDYTSPEDVDFSPNTELANNPLINGGTTGDLVPATDINGNPRDAMPDIGAFEVTAPALPSIVEIVVNSPVHNALESALIAANLVGALSGEGPFTVFAPTDAAFAAISATNQALLQEGDNLSNTLLTHVISGLVLSTDITDGLVAPSLATNTNLVFNITGTGVTVTTATANIANITVVDLLASNGVVHVIDAVLIPAIVDVRDLDAAGLEVTFYPNPVSDKANVRVADSSIRDMQISVLSALGQRLQSWSLSSGNNVLDFSQLPAGTYFLEVNIDGKLYSKTMQKQ